MSCGVHHKQSITHTLAAAQQQQHTTACRQPAGSSSLPACTSPSSHQPHQDTLSIYIHITICKRQLPDKCCTQGTTAMRHAQAGRHCQQTNAATKGLLLLLLLLLLLPPTHGCYHKPCAAQHSLPSTCQQARPAMPMKRLNRNKQSWAAARQWTAHFCMHSSPAGELQTTNKLRAHLSAAHTYICLIDARCAAQGTGLLTQKKRLIAESLRARVERSVAL